ncbi:ABC transporter ATP-binding protein [Mycetocola spongiae]|uniref:ABC transporter ATP-binding protein n=1 Tax=Mycetocola spongiae TaxID=2859226 RepID=UPI001CF5C837|nr:ABC transporter ATP-binding protein [Mycetocola spongiae]UCR87888.1 ABC transporter ATP-binding protein [Mycetocola spongiae]
MSAVPEPAALLELTGVTRYFDGDPDTGIHDVNLRIYRGEFIAILGPSGAGKSTLLNILGLLDIPDAGIYRVDGIPVGSLPERARDRLRSRIFGFMFQQSFILGDSSALDNAGLGLRTQHIPLARRRVRAHEALARLGVDGRARAAGRVLSGGEQQRVALARAIATRPEVLLADEPTGNLDRANGAAVLAYLHELNAAGMTVILITHDENIAATATRQIRVEDGTVLAGAPPGAPRPSRPPEAPAAAREGGRLRRRLTALADDLGDALNVLTTRAGRTLFLLLAFTLGIGGLITSLGIGESASAQVSQRLSAAAQRGGPRRGAGRRSGRGRAPGTRRPAPPELAGFRRLAPPCARHRCDLPGRGIRRHDHPAGPHRSAPGCLPLPRLGLRKLSSGGRGHVDWARYPLPAG